MIISQAGAQDRASIEHLLDLAFGADRHTRTAYRLRENMAPIAALSLVAIERDSVVGSIQCWPLALDNGPQRTTLTLLGPVAVHPDRQNEGIGAALMEACLGKADARGQGAMVLIGDAEYYGRFGFTANVTGGWTVPGPVERHRLLARIPAGQSVPALGALGPASPRRLAA